MRLGLALPTLAMSEGATRSLPLPVLTAWNPYRATVRGTITRVNDIRKKIMTTKSIVSLLLVLFISAAPSTTIAQTRKTVVDLIIRGGTVVTMDSERRVIENGAVAVKGGRIVSAGSATDIDRSYTAPEVVNARGKVIIPGLINGHTHVPMTLFRGLADDLDLQEWLTKYIFPAEAKNVTEEF